MARLGGEGLKIVGVLGFSGGGMYAVGHVGVGGETGEAWGARVSKLSEFSGCQG